MIISFIILGKTVRECKSMYFRFKDQVFTGKRPYNADALEGFLRNEFGERTMADILGPKYATIKLALIKYF